MTLPRKDIDPDGLLEYSVVFTDRSVNHMSKKFVDTMQDMLQLLRETYNAHSAALVSGGGSFAMESVARQFVNDKKVLVVRNGFFSYRWSQILDTGKIAADEKVMKARLASGEGEKPAFAPAPIDEVVAEIKSYQPDVVCAPHVETASGILLDDEYIRALADATHEVGGLFILDCVASGTLWVDMDKSHVDVLISAPQKGWSGTPSAGYVMFSKHAREVMENTTTSSFSMDLKKWAAIADGYVDGSHAYHATMPTDSIVDNLAIMKEAQEIGLDTLRDRQIELGNRIRSMFAKYGFESVAAEGWQSPTVVVVNAKDPAVNYAPAFAAEGVQIAGGVPLMVDEPEDYSSFRIGLFGLDKWSDVDGAVERLEAAVKNIENK